MDINSPLMRRMFRHINLERIIDLLFLLEVDTDPRVQEGILIVKETTDLGEEAEVALELDLEVTGEDTKEEEVEIDNLLEIDLKEEEIMKSYMKRRDLEVVNV